MKKTALIILALLVGFSVYAKHHKRKKKQQATTSSMISVTMRRTPCYGRCPNYEIQLDNDGTAIYTAIRFNPDTGTFTKNIGAAKVKEIIDQFNSYRVDTCQDLYRNRIADLPGINFTIKYKDSTKNIRNAQFGPGFLKTLATAVDDAAKKTDDSWTKVDTAKKN